MQKSARIRPNSWSSTLTLPKSAFPARPLLVDQPRYLEQCSDRLYAWQKGRDSTKHFTLQDGPPYANGNLHIGHAVNKILKDIICRFQLSQGSQVNYVPGWDCHGLPIEIKALEEEHQLGRIEAPHKLEPIDVRHAARNLAAKAIKRQKQEFRAWGVMADWENAWKTMDKQYEVQQLHVFRTLVKEGLIYRSVKPVYWSPSSKTALAEAELEYNEDHRSTAAFVIYPLLTLPNPLADRLGLNPRELSAVIWTTTPWTLPANRAIGIRSDLDYALVKSEKHGLLIVAKSRIAYLQKLCKDIVDLRIYFVGQDLVGATYTDLVFDVLSHPRPLLHASFVSVESGSGLVHLAPGHGLDDYELCLEHGIPAFAPVDNRGLFTSYASPKNPRVLMGKEVMGEGNEAVLHHLSLKGLLLKHQDYKHKYPYDWRSKKPVLIRATKQWFANVGQLQSAAIQSLDAVSFLPASGKERLKTFVERRKEWCISRQRAWGVPIPVLYHSETGEAVLNEDSISHIISIMEDRGIDAWWTDEKLDSAWTPPWLRDAAGNSLFTRGRDTMDVWFDSGTSWTQTRSQLESGNKAADVYLEGTDQHRGWFQSSLLTYIAQQSHERDKDSLPVAPFKTLITHGFTLDQDGRKMSKSLGNVILPGDIMNGTFVSPVWKKHGSKANNKATLHDPHHDAMGPDALRLWVASCDYTRDVFVSQALLKAVIGNLVKYRLTFKLLLGVLGDYYPTEPVPFLDLNIIHQIALLHLKDMETRVLRHFRDFDYAKAVNEITRYINADFSAFYFESIKDAVYTGGTAPSGSSSRKMAQYTLLHIFVVLQQVLASVTPLLVEETWDYTPKQIQTSHGYPFHRLWVEGVGLSKERQSWQNQQLERDIPILLQANGAVKSALETARNQKKTGSSLQSYVVLQFLETPENESTKTMQIFERYQHDLECIFVVSKVDICYEHLPPSVTNADWSFQSEVNIDGSRVIAHVYSPQLAKCVRCWRYAAPNDKGDPEALCDRCTIVLKELRTQKPELFMTEPQAEPLLLPHQLHVRYSFN